jgi:hypothetical protein
MLDRAGFLVLYPEFASTDEDLVTAKLAEAERSIGDAWGEREDEGHGLLTAHRLGLSVNGHVSRLNSDKGQTTYGRDYDRVKLAIAAARPDMRVL